MSVFKYLFQGRHFAAPKHLRSRLTMIDKLERSQPPPPWRVVTRVAVGGLEGVGFADAAELLLVISSSGTGVFDCRSGERVARDESSDLDSVNLVASGIGPLAGQRVRMAGLNGGGLPNGTSDGWGIELYPPSWPDEELVLSQPGQTMLWTKPGQQVSLTKLGGFVTEIRAFGFSPSGRSLIIATSSDLEIFGRD